MIMGMCIGCSPYNAEQTVITQAIAVLRRFGLDAHIYLPGVGMLNGLTAGNYLDSAGTTQGTVDQPVGLVLDAAGGLGVELVVNGDFSNGFTGWTALQPTAGSVAVTGGACRVNSTDGSFSFAQQTPLTQGKTYRLEFDLTVASGACVVDGTGGVYGTFSTSGRPSLIFVALDSVLRFKRQSGVTDFTIDNVVAQEVTGIHASQATTASKPILRRGAVNLALPSGSLATWVVYNGATNTAGSVGLLADFTSRAERVFTGLPATSACTAAITLAGTGSAVIRVRENGGAFALLNAQVIVSLGEAQQIIIPLTTTSFTSVIFQIVASGVVSTVTATDIALFQGTYTAAQIQALGGIPLTTTAPASTALGPQYWQFDGSNDSLSLGGPLFQMADDHCVVLCASRNTVGGERYPFMSSGAGTVALSPAIAFASDGIIKAYWRGDDNILKTANTATSYTPNTPAVVTASKIGNSKKARVNAGAWAINTDAIGAASITGVAIGSRIDGTTPIDGYIYPVIAIKGTVPDADLLLLEKFVANLSGVTL